MATVANLKAKLVLDVGDFSAAADSAVGKAKTMGKGIENALKAASQSWKRSLGQSAMALVGVQMADSLVRSIDERLKSPIVDNIAANLAYAVGEGFKNSLQSIPVAGIIGGWIGSGIGAATDFVGLTSDASGSLEAKQQASREQAARMLDMLKLVQDINQPLERQMQLAQAIDEAERTRLQRAFQLQDLQQKINARGLASGMSGDQIRAESEKIAQQMAATNQAIDERAAAEAAIAESQRQQAEIARQQAAEQQRILDLAEQRQAVAENFLRDLETQLNRETLTEQELFEDQLARLDLTREEIERARELQRLRQNAVATREAEAEAARAAAEAERQAAERLAEAQGMAQRSMEFSNVESLSTAIGGVKVAGMTSNSIERLVPTQEMIKNYSEQIARNTQRMAGAGAP
jgi:hypothetical protein